MIRIKNTFRARMHSEGCDSARQILNTLYYIHWRRHSKSDISSSSNRRSNSIHNCRKNDSTKKKRMEQQAAQQLSQQQLDKSLNTSILITTSGTAPTTKTINATETTTTTTTTPTAATTTDTLTATMTEKPKVSSVYIPYDVDWIFPQLSEPSKWWFLFSEIVIFAVGLFSKIVLVLLNKTHVYNKQRLVDAITKRPRGIPLITVSNHYSCFDDPGIWGILPVHIVCNTFKVRWSLAAHDICFTNKYHSWFFMHGKCIPVIRGKGVYQDAVNLCIEKLKLGHWVHIFPEGKVNMTKEEMRLKWGIGRIIYESPEIPLILPLWHEGMDEVLPNVEPYRLKWGKKVTLNVGQPIDLRDFVCSMRHNGVTEVDARKLITDKIQETFRILRVETENLHYGTS